MSKKTRVRLSSSEADFLNLKIKDDERGRKSARYMVSKEDLIKLNKFKKRTTPTEEKPFILNALNNGYMMDIDAYCNKYRLPRKDVVKYKLVSHTGTPFYNIEFKENIINSEFNIDEILSKFYKNKINNKKTEIKTDNASDFQTLTYSDVHIGLDTDKGKNAMYADKWDRKTVLDTVDEIIKHTLKNKKSDLLIIDELGDFLDGWDGYTTRGGHKLPQNMSNEEAFDCALEFKVRLIDGLHKNFDNIICNNICNDNHSGSFGYILNSAFKSLVDIKYKNVEVKNHRQFINNYIIGDVCFLISHGKDSESLKFGFKPFLDTKQIEKIDFYLKHNKLYSKAKRFIFKKGDSHQLLFDLCTSADFDYFNYGALSPASLWVQNNFKASKQSFVIENFNGIESTIKPIFI